MARRRALVTAVLAAVAALLFPPTLAQAAPPSYVALGDSYSSGTGTGSYLVDGTDCLRSSYAYPSLIASARGYALNLRACSGATVSDVQNSQLGALSTSTAYVTFVAVDADRKPVRVPELIPRNPHQQRRWREAEHRREDRLAHRERIQAGRAS